MAGGDCIGSPNWSSTVAEKLSVSPAATAAGPLIETLPGPWFTVTVKVVVSWTPEWVAVLARIVYCPTALKVAVVLYAEASSLSLNVGAGRAAGSEETYVQS